MCTVYAFNLSLQSDNDRNTFQNASRLGLLILFVSALIAITLLVHPQVLRRISSFYQLNEINAGSDSGSLSNLNRKDYHRKRRQLFNRMVNYDLSTVRRHIRLSGIHIDSNEPFHWSCIHALYSGFSDHFSWFPFFCHFEISPNDGYAWWQINETQSRIAKIHVSSVRIIVFTFSFFLSTISWQESLTSCSDLRWRLQLLFRYLNRSRFNFIISDGIMSTNLTKKLR